MKKMPFALALVALFTLTVPLSYVHAAQMQAGKTVFIPATQVLSENTYLTGEQVTVSSPVAKDLMVAGGRIVVNAPVSGDVLAAGGSIDVLSAVAGDVRVAGGDISIAQSIGGDVVVAGGNVTILPGAVISGDVLVFGGTVDIQGNVNGKLEVHAGDVTVNGAVAGPVDINVGHGVSFGEKTALLSTLTYSAPAEATITDGAKLGNQVVFNKQAVKASHGKGDVARVFFAVLGIIMLVKLLGMLVAALALTYAFKTFALSLSKEAVQKFWPMVGIGFAATVVTPVAIIVLLFSVVGSYLAFILGAFYLLSLLSAGILMCFIASALLAKLMHKEIKVNWKWTVLGVLAVFLASFVPVVGWIAVTLLFFASMGSVVMSLKRDAKAKM
ncbi:MAG: hypothetical protein V4437_01850 [Patescibacteria group bacterium]